MNKAFEYYGWYIFEVSSSLGERAQVAANELADALGAYAFDAAETDLFYECDKEEELSLTVRRMTEKEVDETTVRIDEESTEERSLKEAFFAMFKEARYIQKQEGLTLMEPFVISSTLP